MHPRYRSPGNGFRSNSMGLGLGASRISSDTSSARGRGFYNSEYRSFNNRGFGRGLGQPKSFQPPPQPPPRKGDILVEAGRLAAEYLVSKGLLPQSALSGKWQNGSLKKQVGDDQDFRLQEDLSQEGRTSVHARVGSGASDEGAAAAGRRKHSDNFNLKNDGRGRRRGEYFNRSYSSEWGREYERSGLISDSNKVSTDMEGGDDTISGNYEEQQVGEDFGNGMQTSNQSGSAPENEETTDMESGVDCNNSDEMGSKTISFTVKDENDEEPSKASDDLTKLTMGIEDMKDCTHDLETEKQIIPEGSTIEHPAVEGDLCGKRGSDLLTFCKFAKIPTKTRSALTYRNPKVDQVPKKEVNISDIVPPKGSEASIEDGSHDVSTADMLPTTIHDLKEPDTEVSKSVPVHSAEDAGELGPAYDPSHVKCMRSQSFPDRAFMHDTEQETNQGIPGFGRSASVKERGEKRSVEDGDMNEATKKPREWFPSLVGTARDNLHLSNLSENQDSLQEGKSDLSQGRTPSDLQVMVADTQDSLVNSQQFPKSAGEPSVGYSQEKQRFSSSFKICDLNLMEASDINDNHSNDPVLTYPSIAARKKEAAQIDVDLSMSNSNLSGEYPRSTDDCKNIEVIDLENEEDNDFDNSQRKEVPFTGTEGFPNNSVQNVEDIADVPDSYDSLTISEFLTTFSNCNSATEDINPLQNEMSLHNGEGTLGDDDSIYMSLGEIPLSFIPAWEQPTPQEYGKPF